MVVSRTDIPKFLRLFLKIDSCVQNWSGWAQIQVEGHVALVKGKLSLLPAPVRATDLRLQLVLFSRASNRRSLCYSDIYHLDRGYAALDVKLGSCGAVLQRLD